MLLTSNPDYKTIKRLIINSGVCLFLLLYLNPGSVYGYRQQAESTLNWGELSKKVKSLNPYENSTFEEKNLINLIFGDPLYKSDPITNAIIPGVIESGVMLDSTSWLYGIRPDIRFQDGSPLTSEDVIFSIETYKMFIESSGRFFNNEISKIDSISIMNRLFFRVFASRKVGNYKLMFKNLPILSREYYEGNTQA